MIPQNSDTASTSPSRENSAIFNLRRLCLLPSLSIFLCCIFSVSLSFLAKFHFKTDAFICTLSFGLLAISACIAVLRMRANKIMICAFVTALAAAIALPNLRGKTTTPSEKEPRKFTVESFEKSKTFARIVFSSEKNNTRGCAYTPPETNAFPGDCVIFETEAEKLEVKPENAFLLRDGINASAVFTENTILINKPDRSLREKMQLRLMDVLNRLYEKNSNLLVKSLITGNSSNIPYRLTNDFRRCGALHILAASGLHAAMAAALPLMVFSLMGLNRKAALIAASAGVALFLAITDMPVSLMRACVMFWVASAGYILNRESCALNCLLLSGGVLIIIFPQDLYSLGFHLSFAATLGIILFSDKLLSIFSFLPKFLAASISVSIAAQIFVIPLIALVFGEVNFTGFISNIILVPAFNAILMLSGASIFAVQISDTLAKFIASLNSCIIEKSVSAVEFFSSLNGHFLLHDSVRFSALIPLLLAIAIIFARGKKAAAAISALILSAFVSFYALSDLPQTDTAGNLRVERRKTETIITGNPDDNSIVLLRQRLSSGRIENVTFDMGDATNEKMQRCKKMLRQICVDKIIIRKNNFSPAAVSFFRLLEKENIALEFAGDEKKQSEKQKESANGRGKRDLPET